MKYLSTRREIQDKYSLTWHELCSTSPRCNLNDVDTGPRSQAEGQRCQNRLSFCLSVCPPIPSSATNTRVTKVPTCLAVHDGLTPNPLSTRHVNKSKGLHAPCTMYRAPTTSAGSRYKPSLGPLAAHLFAARLCSRRSMIY